MIIRDAKGFRPLTGINFNSINKSRIKIDLFPSPHGDKFQRWCNRRQERSERFPSPHGDKFQLINCAG